VEVDNFARKRQGALSAVFAAVALLSCWLTPGLSADAANAATTATFGKTAVGRLSDKFVSERKRVNRYALPQAGSVATLSVYLAPTGTPGRQELKGVIYSDASGKPDALLGVSKQLALNSKDAAGWYELSFAAAMQLPAGSYWIGVITGPKSDVAGFRYDRVEGSRDYNANRYASGPTSRFGNFTTDDEQMSLFATYTPQPAGEEAEETEGVKCTSSCYYVSTTGSDATGDGSQAKPWRTINHAGEQVTAQKSTLIVRRGTYHENAHIAAPETTVLGEAKPTVNGFTVGGAFSFALYTINGFNITESAGACVQLGIGSEGEGRFETVRLQDDVLARCNLESIGNEIHAGGVELGSNVTIKETNLAPGPLPSDQFWLDGSYLFNSSLSSVVQREPRVFLIFWGKEWEEAGTVDSRTLPDVRGFFEQLPGSGWNQTLTQYWESSAFNEAATIKNNPRLIGTWLDSSAPPAKWYERENIYKAIQRAIEVNGWKADAETQFIVLGQEQAEQPPFCGAHSLVYGTPSIEGEPSYAAVSTNAVCHGGLTLSGDQTVSIAAHEYAETATDRSGNGGWADAEGALGNAEVGDLCQGMFFKSAGTPGGQVVQGLWSDVAHECVGESAAGTPLAISPRLEVKRSNVHTGEELEASVIVHDPGGAATTATFQIWTGQKWESVGSGTVTPSGGIVTAFLKAPSEDFWLRVEGPANGPYAPYYKAARVR
jgi:hypothetical protein